MTRQEIIDGFNKTYMANIAKETAKNPGLGGIEVHGDKLREIYNNSLAEWGEQLIAMATYSVLGESA